MEGRPELGADQQIAQGQLALCDTATPPETPREDSPGEAVPAVHAPTPIPPSSAPLGPEGEVEAPSAAAAAAPAGGAADAPMAEAAAASLMEPAAAEPADGPSGSQAAAGAPSGGGGTDTGLAVEAAAAGMFAEAAAETAAAMETGPFGAAPAMAPVSPASLAAAGTSSSSAAAAGPAPAAPRPPDAAQMLLRLRDQIPAALRAAYAAPHAVTPEEAEAADARLEAFRQEHERLKPAVSPPARPPCSAAC